jgi:hypothetical protein
MRCWCHGDPSEIQEMITPGDVERFRRLWAATEALPSLGAECRIDPLRSTAGHRGGDMDRRSYMKGMGAALASYAVASGAKEQPAMESSREHLTKAEFDQLFKQLSNWGRWGKGDQLGTLNLITPARRREAAALVREGVCVSLARDLNEEKSVDNPDPLLDVMNLGVDGKFNMDTYTVNFHGFAFSHFDFITGIQTATLPAAAPKFWTPPNITMAFLRAEC